MFERRSLPLAKPEVFRRRLVTTGSIGFVLVVVSLVIGIAGYASFEHLSLVDAFLNASMILSGMGPLEPLKTQGGKLFAGFYALYSGLALIVIVGIVLAPIVHRFLHRFHLEESKRG